MPRLFKDKVLGGKVPGGKVLVAAALAWSVLPVSPAPAEALLQEPPLLGREWRYTVQPKDTLSRIAARYGLDLRRLLAINGLSTREPLRAGQQLHLSDRHIPPPPEGAAVVVNIPDALLYRYDGETVRVYPVGLGEPLSKTTGNPRRWRTPIGSFTVVEKRKDPIWNIPPSIQEEMREAGKEVVTPVPAGPKNPLGTRWIGLSAWGYGIHGTNAPASIGRYSTHGCVRMRSEHAEEIFEVLAKGAPVRIVYQPAKLARDGEAVFLEVSRDVYGQIPDMAAHVRRLIQDAGLTEAVDPHHVRRVVQGRWGIATRIDRAAPVPFVKPTPQPSASPDPVPLIAPSPPHHAASGSSQPVEESP